MILKSEAYLRRKVHISGNKYYYIHVPAKISSDSQFPFREGDAFRMLIDTRKRRMTLLKIAGRKRQGPQR